MPGCAAIGERLAAQPGPGKAVTGLALGLMALLLEIVRVILIQNLGYVGKCLWPIYLFRCSVGERVAEAGWLSAPATRSASAARPSEPTGEYDEGFARSTEGVSRTRRWPSRA